MNKNRQTLELGTAVIVPLPVAHLGMPRSEPLKPGEVGTIGEPAVRQFAFSDLVLRHRQCFRLSPVFRIRQFDLSYLKRAMLPHLLGWSYVVKLLKIDIRDTIAGDA